MGAHASAHSREIAFAVNDFHGISEITLGEFGNPFRDVIAYRASSLAERHLAVKTALGLPDSLREGVSFRYFLKIIRHRLFL
jgi:hypothetical protein